MQRSGIEDEDEDEDEYEEASRNPTREMALVAPLTVIQPKT